MSAGPQGARQTTVTINRSNNEQEVSVSTFRRIIGVADGKYENFPQLKQSVITPAVQEVNTLSDFKIEIEPIREGGRQRGTLTGFRLRWERKEPQEWQSTLDELLRLKVGRKARIRGEVDEAA